APMTSAAQTVTVLVRGDTVFEPEETFAVVWDASQATLAVPQSTVVIHNDDARPLLSFSPQLVAVAEGSFALRLVALTVTMDHASSEAVTVQYHTEDGTATAAGGDYRAASGTLTFSPGELSKTITVLISSDRLKEADEDFFVQLTNPTGAGLIRPG